MKKMYRRITLGLALLLAAGWTCPSYCLGVSNGGSAVAEVATYANAAAHAVHQHHQMTEPGPEKPRLRFISTSCCENCDAAFGDAISNGTSSDALIAFSKLAAASVTFESPSAPYSRGFASPRPNLLPNSSPPLSSTIPLRI